jgi:hypothetical protein
LSFSSSSFPPPPSSRPPILPSPEGIWACANWNSTLSKKRQKMREGRGGPMSVHQPLFYWPIKASIRGAAGNCVVSNEWINCLLQVFPLPILPPPSFVGFCLDSSVLP